MSSKYKGLQIAFEADLNEDQIQAVVDAIKMIKFVGDVAPIETNSNDWINRTQMKHELIKKFYGFINDELVNYGK